VLADSTVRLLEPYLAFRHRFRNLYLFDLEPGLVVPLLDGVDAAWAAADRDLATFAATLDAMAEQLSD
jgi:hypothetical protein